MNPERLPKYLVLIRWGSFRLDLVGRVQIIAAVTLVATFIGLKFYIF